MSKTIYETEKLVQTIISITMFIILTFWNKTEISMSLERLPCDTVIIILRSTMLPKKALSAMVSVQVV